jgi:branched-chain amino acid transport system substrate-binding protein
MQAGNSADRASIAKNIMDVANGPGTKIYPGELKKGLDLLAQGKKVDYEVQLELLLLTLVKLKVLS